MPDPNGAAAPSETPGPAELGALTIRAAGPDDLAPLIAIENAVFTSDRISRRSFRHFLASPRAILRVAEIGGAVAGYHLVLFRRGTAAARLYSLAVAPRWQRHGLGARLLANAEEAAFEADRAVLRLEVEAGNAAALALYRSAGYRVVAKLAAYYESGADGLRLEKPLRFGAIPPAPAPFYEQTTEFTCGAACLMMVLAARKPGISLDPMTEVRLWRRATTVFLTAGLGGCEPYGLALTLAEEGLRPEIHVTEPGALMLQTVRNPEKRKVMELAQADFRARAAARGIPVHRRRLEVRELAERLRRGALALLLVSGNRMFGKRVPHWILAHGADARHVFLHDPWVEDKAFESATDAANIPAPFAELDRMWRWGATRLRAAVLIAPDDGDGAR
ncbi:MAG TPA: peptidase C39 family protein [Thermohalobaculum sp.]|nr:peptidase C39 family protein [Thermohalobaculum sp.]